MNSFTTSGERKVVCEILIDTLTKSLYQLGLLFDELTELMESHRKFMFDRWTTSNPQTWQEDATELYSSRIALYRQRRKNLKKVVKDIRGTKAAIDGICATNVEITPELIRKKSRRLHCSPYSHFGIAEY